MKNSARENRCFINVRPRNSGRRALSILSSANRSGGRPPMTRAYHGNTQRASPRGKKRSRRSSRASARLPLRTREWTSVERIQAMPDAQLYAARQYQGLCVECGHRPPTRLHTRCRACQAYQTAYHAAQFPAPPPPPVAVPTHLPTPSPAQRDALRKVRKVQMRQAVQKWHRWWKPAPARLWPHEDDSG